MKIVPIIFLASIFFSSCVSLKEFRLTKYIYQGKTPSETLTIGFEKDYQGEISYFSPDVHIKDTVHWRYYKGIVYFDMVSNENSLPNEQYISSLKLLYSKRGLLHQNNGDYLFLHKYDNRKIRDFPKYISDLKLYDREVEIMRRCFGDSIAIDNKFAKVLPQKKVFSAYKKQKSFWLYETLYKLNEWLYWSFHRSKL